MQLHKRRIKMANIGCRIYPDFVRPSKEVLDAFKGLPAANIDDNMNRTAAILDPAIRQVGCPKGQLIGPAFTVKVPEGDNLMFHKAMDMAQSGDVIVIDAGGCTSRSIFGELMSAYCRKRGIAGIIVDGSIRDYTGIAEMENFIVYAKGVTPNGPYKNGPGELRGVISLGGRIVHPGDIIVGDEDGVAVIEPGYAKEILEKTRTVAAKEEAIMKCIVEQGTYDRPWVDQKLKEIGCEIL
jgi:regulator of RNase E activity RraA